MDDFDYDEQEELERKRQQQQQDNDSIADRAKNLKDKYDNAKENIDKAKNIREKLRQSGNASKVTSEAGETAAKSAGQTAAKGAGQTAAKSAGQTAAKSAGKAAAEKAGQEVAKKAAVKGAVAASGAATAGVGTAAAVAMEARDQLKKAGKKLNDKFDNAVESATGLKLKGKKKFIIILIIFIAFFIFITTGATYLASEDTYEDLAAIIKKRQARYAESGKTFKPVLLMTNAEINEILTKDYLEPGQTLKDILNLKLDICYKTYLQNLYNGEYDNYIPSDSNDPNSTYAEKIAIIEKYLKASRSNFNKIKWIMFGGTGGVQMEKIDLKDNLSSASALLLNLKDNYLSMPKLDKYKISPSASAEQMKTMYLDMVEKYLQPWVVPYALNIASQDNDFGKSVLEDMFHPINVTLYELDRLIRTTITYYYLETTVKVDYYDEEKYDCEDSDDDGESDDNCSTRYVYSHTETFDSTTATTWEDTNTEKYSVSLKSGADGYIRAGIKSGPDVTRDLKPYRHVPKLTYVEAFYEIINAKYNIIPINEANPPVETSTTLDSSGKETKIDIWDENLASNGVESKSYKVSYIGDENETFPRKTVSQKEQLKKKFYGVEATETSERIPPQVQGYTYDDLAFGFAQIEKYYNTAGTGGVIGSGSLTSIPEGGFAWPVPSILGSGVNIDSTISSPYGTRVHPISGSTSFHPAIDIGSMGKGDSTSGPDIVAVQEGIVNVKSDPDGYGPEYIIIEHQNGYYSLYAHFYSICVTDGQKVTQGQKIGVMGTRGSSTGVHLHFAVYKGTSVDDVFNDSNALDPRQLYNSDGTAIGGVTNTGTVTSGTGNATTSGQGVIDQMCAKAIDMAENIRNLRYRQPPDRDVDTIEELTKNPWHTDCSGYVSAMYKAYLGIDVGVWTGEMMDKANAGYSESGWTAEYNDWDGDISVLLPGDMLINSHHVGLYVGGGKQVDHGGPNEGDIGPNYKGARGTYTGYIRYTNPDVVTSTASENVIGSTSDTATSKNSSGQKISRIEWYLDWQKAKNDSTGGTSGNVSTGGAVGSSDLVSFLILGEGGVDLLSADGTKYIVHDDGAGNPTVGMGVYIEANRDKFIARGLDPDSLSIGTEVDKAIVDEITTEELSYFIDKVNNTLADAGITDLTDAQKNALISRAYNCGNINEFPAAYQQYGNTQALYDNYMKKPDHDNKGDYQPGLTKRREAEWQLFNTGVYPDTIY